MTRKDYILLARALADVSPKNTGLDKISTASVREHQWRACVDSIALALGKDNGRFDVSRFREAVNK